MDQDEEGEEEGGKSVESVGDLGELLDVLQYLVFLLHHFEYLEHPCQLYELVHSTYSGDSDNLIKIFRVSQNFVEWNNGEDINEEPGLDIALADDLPVLDQVEVLIVKCCVEDNDYVHQEKEINDIVYYQPILFFFLDKSDPAWSDQARKDENQHNEHVPIHFEGVLRLDHAYLLVLSPGGETPLLVLPKVSCVAIIPNFFLAGGAFKAVHMESLGSLQSQSSGLDQIPLISFRQVLGGILLLDGLDMDNSALSFWVLGDE